SRGRELRRLRERYAEVRPQQREARAPHVVVEIDALERDESLDVAFNRDARVAERALDEQRDALLDVAQREQSRRFTGELERLRLEPALDPELEAARIVGRRLV